jgi:hypothetical protein
MESAIAQADFRALVNGCDSLRWYELELAMPSDYEAILLSAYTDAEIDEIRVLMEGWNAATYTSIAHSIVDHAERHGFQGEFLKYLRKANNFNKRGARRKALSDGSTRWNKGLEFLIERDGKIVSYGEN